MMSAEVQCHVAARFFETAQRRGDVEALISKGESIGFADLAIDVERLAAGLTKKGIKLGDRVAVLIPPSQDFFSCVFALFQLGAIPVLIDPGIGWRSLKRCLAETAPKAFIGSPKAHLARFLGRWAPTADILIVANGVFPGFESTRELRRLGGINPLPAVASSHSTAAILFTSGSTGAPKGAVYTHENFCAQLDQLGTLFGIKDGDVSVATFPLFALFDIVLGMTVIIPKMNFTRPGFVDPLNIIGPLQKYQAQQLFGSPALIDRLGRYGEKHGIALPHLKRVMSAGAPVSPSTLGRFAQMLRPGVEIFTPYGATEALPVALAGSEEILGQTSSRTQMGEGVCVGRPVPGVVVSIIEIIDTPLPRWDDVRLLPQGEVGEIIVCGQVVTREYFKRPSDTAAAKIYDGDKLWHRMGDLGYFDAEGRLWFCGRKSERVKSPRGDLYTAQVEGIFNSHSLVRKAALIDLHGEPVLCVEPEENPDYDIEILTRELWALGERYPISRQVKKIFYFPMLPVDTRHNAKISRDKLRSQVSARSRVL